MSRRKRENNYGQCSREPDQSQGESRMRALVKFPAERNLKDLPADYTCNSAERIELNVAIAKSRVGIVRVRYLRLLSR